MFTVEGSKLEVGSVLCTYPRYLRGVDLSIRYCLNNHRLDESHRDKSTSTGM